MAEGDDDGAGTLAQQQCGRCRKYFDGDPTLVAAALPEWWLCADCRTSLLGTPATDA